MKDYGEFRIQMSDLIETSLSTWSSMPRTPKAIGGDGHDMPVWAPAEDLNFEDIATIGPTTPVVSPEVENVAVFVPTQDDTTRAQQCDQPQILGGFQEMSSTRSMTTWTMRA